MNKLQKMKQELEKHLEKHLKLLENIEILEENEWGNTVRIGDKVFSFLRPEPNDKDVFKGEGKYEHVRHIKGNAIEDYLGEGQQMFAGKDDFEAFIKENIPGKNRKIKLENYADLMGLELCDGYAWVSRLVGDKACGLGLLAGSAGTGWDGHDYAQPVIVFKASE